VKTLPLTHSSILFVHNVIDNPDNPNSLRAIADGDTPLFSDSPVDHDLLDALTAKAKLQGWVDEKLGFVDTLSAPPELPTLANRLAGSAEARRAECIDAPAFDIGGDCSKLAELMTYQTGLEVAKRSAAEQVQDDIAAALLSVAGLTPAAPVAASLGTSAWAIETIEDGSQGLYPSEFIDEATDYVPTVTEFPEDFTEPGRWSEFRVTAVSEGWRFDDKIVEAVEQMVSVNGSFDTPFGTQPLIDKVDGLIQVNPNAAIKSELLDNVPGELKYCAQTWAGIDCTGLPNSAGSSPSLQYDSEALTYQPVEVGTTTLLVETMPVFGVGKSTGETKVIETKRLDVFLDPFQATLDVSTQQTFTVRVDGAANPSVLWTSSGANFTPGVGTASLTTPPAPWETPITVTAKSLSDTGLREGKVDSDPRTKTALVTFGGGVLIFIEPEFACIAPGETKQLNPQVVGLEEGPYTLAWNLVEGSGSVNQSGLYQAPPAGSTRDRISVEVVGVDDVIAFAEVAVGECNCSYEALLTGGVSASWENNQAAYVVDVSEEFALYTFFFDNNTPGFIADVGGTAERPAPTPGSTGTWECSFELIDGNLKGWSDYEIGPDQRSMFLDVYELTENYMVGRFRGSVRRWDDVSETHLFTEVSVQFRAGAWEGAQFPWPCH
jgi:hypothetical protein